MKTNTFAILAIGTFLLFSCGESTENQTGDGPENSSADTLVVPKINRTSYQLMADKSTIKWDRELDQKSMKRTMKIFGADVEVDMDAVTLSMTGNVTPKSGTLVTADDIAENGSLFFDMATFKFAEEKGSGLFDTKQYPISELKFLEFEDYAGDNYNYTAKCELTIQGHTEEVTIPLYVGMEGSEISIGGIFSFNTLLFPLRAPDQEATINKDVITVNLDLKYSK